MIKKDMPDVALNATIDNAPLDFVGMSNLQLPLLIPTTATNASLNNQNTFATTQGNIEVGVDLVNQAKGIHMSRLYALAMNRLSTQLLTVENIHQLLQAMLDTQQELSGTAQLRIDFDVFQLRPSLISKNQGWRNYPVELLATLTENTFSLEVSLEIIYSSTCPCSAALSRQLIMEKFANDFSDQPAINKETILDWLTQEENICATPHSQRSAAFVKFNLINPLTQPDSFWLPLIDDLERTLATPVQALVKREDEQEFARLNSSNLMFCEDSARKLKSWIEQPKNSTLFDTYQVRVEHYESLHAHDAVAEFSGELQAN